MQSTTIQRLLWCALLLCVFYTSGCIVFVNLERAAELQSYAENRELYARMKELYSFHHCEDPAFQDLTFCRSQAAFSESLRIYFNQHGNSVVDLEQWTVLGTCFFLTHLGTTIGYGNSHPQTALGQLATIFYALLGVPIMGYVLANVARFDLRVSVFVLENVFGAKMNTIRRQMLVLWSLLVFFLVAGAVVYSMLEPWTYLQSLYFCFVTLTTIGFGDFLPSSPASKAFSIFYMISGLGVCASIIAVLTGLVAESHDTMDSFLSQKMREECLQSDTCPECCCGVGESRAVRG